MSSCKVVLSGKIAEPFAAELRQGLESLGRKPLLVGLLANSDEAARMYAKWTEKTCEDLGFRYELREVSKEQLEEKVMEANNEDQVDGILVYFPVFGPGKDQYIQQCIAQEKDCEGLSNIFIKNLYQNVRYLDKDETQKSILPCTPLGCVKVLEYLKVYNTMIPYGNRLYGKTITVVNRSEIVGRPLAALLANDGAVVYSCDINGVQKYTRGEGLSYVKHQVTDSSLTTEEAAEQSDVVITGVPSPAYKFPVEHLKSGAVCVNFSSEKNFSPEVKSRASLYVPMMGKVTIMMLLRNLLRLCENKRARTASASASATATAHSS